MRQIKFRMWNKEIKEMYDVGLINFQQRLIFMKHYEGYTQSSFALEDVELMQFTGLYDKNGKKIYEGDILQDEFCVYKVVFEDGCFVGIVEKLLKPCGTQKGLCYTLNDILNLISDDTEIIGNIYENPELLERSSNGD